MLHPFEIDTCLNHQLLQMLDKSLKLYFLRGHNFIWYRHSSEDRRSVSSGGIQRSASVDLLETGSCSSSTGSPTHQPASHPADPSLSHNYGRVSFLFNDAPELSDKHM